jgi:hypothetical protein
MNSETGDINAILSEPIFQICQVTRTVIFIGIYQFISKVAVVRESHKLFLSLRVKFE